MPHRVTILWWVLASVLAGCATYHASAVGTPSRAAARWAKRVLVLVRPWADHSPAAIAAANSAAIAAASEHDIADIADELRPT